MQGMIFGCSSNTFLQVTIQLEAKAFNKGRKTMWTKGLAVVVMAAFLITLGWGGGYCAQSGDAGKDAAADGPRLDPLAEKILKEASEYLKSMKEFSFHAEIVYDAVVPPNGKLQYGASADVAVKRPNKLYFEYSDDNASRRLWYDGKTVTVLDGIHQVYGVIPGLSSTDETLDMLMRKYGWSIPLSEMVHSDPYQALMKSVQEGHYIGLHKVDGVRTHHLAFIGDRVDWQVWIEDGTELVPRKVTITYKTLPSSPQYSALFSEWNLAARLPDMVFSPILPKGAEKIEFLEAIKKESPTQ